MTKHQFILSLIISAGMTAGLAGCSNDSDDKENKSGDHVWKQQTDNLKTSKDVAKQLQDSLKQQQKNMDENN